MACLSSSSRDRNEKQPGVYVVLHWWLLLGLLFVAPINHVHSFPVNTLLANSHDHNKKCKSLISLRASIGGRLVDNTEDEAARSIASSSKTDVLDWSFIDSVCLIHCPNGDADGSRIKSTQSILSEVNLLDCVTIKEFETDDEDRVRGCYTSHISVFRDTIEADSKNSAKTLRAFDFWGVFQKPSDLLDDKTHDLNLLVFEDNLDFGNRMLTQETIDAISKFVEKNKNQWDVIHLAYIPYVPDLQVSKTDEKRIVKLSTSNQQSALGTTAYIINKRAMKRLIEEDDKNGYTISIPDAMADLFGESRYALNPTVFVRAPATKSLVNPQLDDLRSILFRPNVVSLVQQILVITGLSTTTLLPLVILLLVATSIISANYSFNSALEFARYGTLDGPLLFPIINAIFSFFSLGLIIQGIVLAPSPPSDDNDEDNYSI